MEFIQCYRVCIYVPEVALDDFIKNVSPHITGFLGSYDHVCWWSEKGTEQYRKTDAEQIQQVNCFRVECALPLDEDVLRTFIEKHVKPNHPWEEPVVTVSAQKICNFAKEC